YIDFNQVSEEKFLSYFEQISLPSRILSLKFTQLQQIEHVNGHHEIFLSLRSLTFVDTEENKIKQILNKIPIQQLEYISINGHCCDGTEHLYRILISEQMLLLKKCHLNFLTTMNFNLNKIQLTQSKVEYFTFKCLNFNCILKLFQYVQNLKYLCVSLYIQNPSTITIVSTLLTKLKYLEYIHFRIIHIYLIILCVY
ncbi:unnamed protein product, partial [Didymodactylos carnosus]